MLWAHGQTGQFTLQNHGTTNRGVVEIDFLSPGCADPLCSGNGVCNEFLGVCECDEGWQGPACTDVVYRRSVSSRFCAATSPTEAWTHSPAG